MKASDIPTAAYAEPDYEARNERVFQRSVETRATRYGLLVFHDENPRGSRKGYPDLHIAGPGGSVFRELKVGKGTTTVEQQQWLDLLTQIGLDAKVWRPEHMQSGEIEQTLARLCRPLVLSTVEQLRAEVTRLRLDADIATAAANVVLGERDNARAQLDSLRDDLAKLRTAYDEQRVALELSEQERLNAREEVARLRQVPEVGGARRG